MTKIVQIQYSTKSAGSSAIRLQNAFIESNQNIESTIVSLQVDNNEGIVNLGRNARIIARIDSKIQSLLTQNSIKKYGYFSYPLLGTNIAKLKEVVNADIIYIHWALGGLLNFRNITKIVKLNKPVIIVMHDMWFMTGGCHYSFTCEKYTSECYSCQIFPEQLKIDLSRKGFNKKRKLYLNYNNLYFISPSKWLFNCAKSSELLRNKSIFYIPNVIDDTVFKSVDKKIAKQLLNIVDTDVVIAFGATKIDSPYKGWKYVPQALEILKQENEIKNISVMIFGSGYKKEIADAIPFKTYFLGNLTDDYSLNLAYNAANVFLVPSLADNQPTTVMESLCSGTPVVGFNIGGIPDMISHKNNGYLATFKSSEDLAKGIKFCIQNQLKGKALPFFNKNAVVKNHIDLIQKISVETT